ncbi:MAG TPA: hypothetical protein V6D17_21930, partial [Candidatus Obscuribacterales bacterium]
LAATLEAGLDETMLALALQAMNAARAEISSSRDRIRLSLKELDWRARSRTAELPAWMAPNLLRQFDENLAKIAGGSKREQPFLSHELKRVFYRSYFYSSVYLMTKGFLFLPSARVNCARLADCLKAAPDADLSSRQLERWVRLAAAAYGKTLAADTLEKAIMELDGLGAAPTLALYTWGGGALYSSPVDRLIPTGELLFSRLDARPDGLLSLAAIAEKSFLDLELQRKLIHQSIIAGTGDSIEMELLRRRVVGDVSAMSAMLTDRRLTDGEKLAILKALESIDKAQCTREYERMIAGPSAPSSIVHSFVRFLTREKKYDQGLRVLNAWLDKKRDGDLEVPLRLNEAELLYLKGEHRRSVSVLESLTNCNLPTYLKLQALNALALNDFSSAKAWSNLFLDHYPGDIDAIAAAVEVNWKLGDFDWAASMLARYKSLPRSIWKSVIGKAFLRSLTSPSHIDKALAALKNNGIDGASTIGQLAAAAYVMDKPELALRILSRVSVPAEQLPDLLTCNYRYLKRWKGKEAALQWFKSRMQPAERPAVASYAFFSGQDELLWDFIPDTTEQTWLLRAAAAVLDRDLSHERRAKLIRHFEQSSDWTAPIGRHLLAMKNGDQVTSIKLATSRRYVASFYVGWAALAKPGNFLSDTEWLRLCLEEPQPQLNEYSWAKGWLADIVIALSGQPLMFSDKLLQRLHVVSPSASGDWSEQRRFILSTDATR